MESFPTQGCVPHSALKHKLDLFLLRNGLPTIVGKELPAGQPREEIAIILFMSQDGVLSEWSLCQVVKVDNY